MTINTKQLRRECDENGWAITVDFDELRFLITAPSTSVSVTITPNHQTHLYCAGPFNEVVAVIGAIAKCGEGR